MSENIEKTVNELFEELKQELTFFPSDEIRDLYMFGYMFTLIA